MWPVIIRDRDPTCLKSSRQLESETMRYVEHSFLDLCLTYSVERTVEVSDSPHQHASPKQTCKILRRCRVSKLCSHPTHLSGTKRSGHCPLRNPIGNRISLSRNFSRTHPWLPTNSTRGISRALRRSPSSITNMQRVEIRGASTCLGPFRSMHNGRSSVAVFQRCWEFFGKEM